MLTSSFTPPHIFLKQAQRTFLGRVPVGSAVLPTVGDLNTYLTEQRRTLAEKRSALGALLPGGAVPGVRVCVSVHTRACVFLRCAVTLYTVKERRSRLTGSGCGPSR